MSRWSSFKSQQVLTENWRKFLQEEDDEPEDDAEESEEESQVVYGLNSTDNPDSLKRLLSGVIEDDVAAQIINLIASAADDEGVMLEAVSLQGSKSEQDRVFSGETTKEILQGLAGLGLNTATLKKVIKVLNQWGKLNTVKFEKPVTATPATPVEEPDEEPDESPESERELEDWERPLLSFEPESDDFEEEDTEEIPKWSDRADLPSDDEPEKLVDRRLKTPEDREELVAKDDGRNINYKTKDIGDSILRAARSIDFIDQKFKDYEQVRDFVDKIKELWNKSANLYDNGHYVDSIKELYDLAQYLREESQEGGTIPLIYDYAERFNEEDKEDLEYYVDLMKRPWAGLSERE